jgi:hypothetical protein
VAIRALNETLSRAGHFNNQLSGKFLAPQGVTDLGSYTMISPDYLKRPPEKEAVLVEHSTKHTIVLKPGFYNRRNQSALLKSSFPAGFHIKNKLTDRLGESIVNDGRHIKPYQSFTDWTKGESDTHEDSVSADLTDPYADVAGPYLTEILANRPKLDRPSYDASKHSSVIATEVELHHRTKKSYKPQVSCPLCTSYCAKTLKRSGVFFEHAA